MRCAIARGLLRHAYGIPRNDRVIDTCQDILVTKYIVIGIHGLGGRAAWLSRINAEFAKYNASQTQNQFILHARDLSGFGEHGDGRIRSFHDWLREVQDYYQELKRANPDAKFAVLGHSLGGVIATNLYEIYPGDALILSVPGYKGAKATFNPWFVAKVLFTYFTSPNTLINLPAPGVKRQGMINGKLYIGDPTDEDEHKTKAVSANLLWQILQLGKHSERNLARLRKTPVLHLQVENDTVVDNTAQDKLLNLVEPAYYNKIIIPGELHDWPLYDAVEETVPQIVKWISENC